MDGHLDEMEAGLNNLKDLFKSNEYSVDGDTLLGVSNSSSRPFYNVGAIDPQYYAQVNGTQSNSPWLTNEELWLSVVLKRNLCKRDDNGFDWIHFISEFHL